MKYIKQQYSFILFVLCILTFFSCSDKETHQYTKVEPAQMEHIEGSELSKLTLTEKAAKRLDIETTKVKEVTTSDKDVFLQKIVPYSSVLYDTDGNTWVYTNPNPLVFIRQEIKVATIEGQKAFLSEGPSTGVAIVTQGAAELLGTEYHVGH